jgi:hypothetical protein
MSWVKNGLLLATGGIIGLCVAAALEADNDESERSEGLRDVDGIAVLGEKLRREAEWAMEECTSDEERDAVYAELKASIGALQEKLGQRGAEIIAELEAQFEEKGEDTALNPSTIASSERTQSIRAAVDELAQSLDETLKGLQAKKFEISGAAAS